MNAAIIVISPRAARGPAIALGGVDGVACEGSLIRLNPRNIAERERLEFLHDGGEMELVARTGKPLMSAMESVAERAGAMRAYESELKLPSYFP